MTAGEIHITTLANLRQPGSVTQARYSHEASIDLFCRFVTAEVKDSVRMYSGAVYGVTPYRNDQNVTGMALAVIDFDNTATDAAAVKHPLQSPTLPEDHFDNLTGTPFFFHSTHSNTDTWPKWRLIIPLARIVTLTEWPFVVQGIITLMGGVDPGLDATCFELSRAFFVPSSPAAHVGARFAGWSDGAEVHHVRG